MDFPLYVHTYELNGRIYRRNPYTGFRCDEEAELRGGDTADLYADDDQYVHTECSVREGSEMVNEEDTSTVLTQGMPHGPPPGFAIHSNVQKKPSTLQGINKKHPSPDSCEHTQNTANIQYDATLSKWSFRMTIPKEMMGLIIGAKGLSKKKLETETDCRLTFPDRSKKANYVDIISTLCEESVSRCRDRIELLVMGKRERTAFTHFVSLPLNHPHIQSTFSQFAELVQNDDHLPASCREASAFQEASKLHLTVVMLTLLDQTEKESATKALEHVINTRVRDIIENEPMEIELKGLSYMNDDPTKVKVLYANAHSHKLQQVVNVISDGMTEVGLAQMRSNDVKIHCTLINSRYASEKGSANTGIDVERLMQKYADFDFGMVNVSQVHLSSRVDPKSDDGYYACVASFDLLQ